LQWISLEPQLSAENEVLSVLSEVLEAFNSMKQVAVAIVLILSFSYSCESFSTMNFIKSDIRNSLSHIDNTNLVTKTHQVCSYNK